MELPVLSSIKVDTPLSVSVTEKFFNRPRNDTLIHQVITSYLAGARAGTKAQKSRSDCRGGGAKPWRQKGTGRARSGSIRNPIWKGGGKAFAASPRNYSQKVNRKMYRAFLAVVFSELLRQEALFIVDEFTLTVPKTRELVNKLSALPVPVPDGRALILVSEDNRFLNLASRNLYDVEVASVSHLNPVDLIKVDHVILTIQGIKKLEENVL